MQLVLIKLFLTPLLMVTVSWSARRWGPGIGGLLAGLPLTSGPISIYLCAEQGPGFAATAASNSLLSLTPVALFSIVYSQLADRVPMALFALASGGAFLCTSCREPPYPLGRPGSWDSWLSPSDSFSFQTKYRQSFKSAILDGTCRPACSRPQ